MKYIFIFALGLYGVFVFISHIYVKYKDMANEVQQEQEKQNDSKEKKTRKEKKEEKKLKRKEKFLNRKLFRIDEGFSNRSNKNTEEDTEEKRESH